MMANAPDDARALRVRLACDDAVRPQARWVMDELLRRARVTHWREVQHADVADVVWGDPADAAAGPRGMVLDLVHDPSSWRFRRDAPPDVARDPLATAAWWLSRVEELLAHAAGDRDAFDEHGRFRYAASYAARADSALATPVDDIAIGWRDPLASWATVPTTAFRVICTHDIDLPLRWGSGGARRTVRLARDAVRSRQLRAALAHAGALLDRPVDALVRRDPWCNARRIARLERRHGATSTSYLLVGGGDSHDGPMAMLAAGTPRYARTLRALDADRIGLHGSYRTSIDPALLVRERDRVDELAGQHARDHRFHYLRHRPVDAWGWLDAAGMRTDASLGWAEHPGFRAGTAHPFHAWQHDAGRALDLVVIPLAVMDATFDQRYLGGGTGAQWRRYASDIIDVLARTGGAASVLVHNERLAANAHGGWSRAYARLLGEVRRRGGRACSVAELVTSMTDRDRR